MLPKNSLDSKPLGKVYINPLFKAATQFSTTQQLQMLLNQQQHKISLSQAQPPQPPSIHINPQVFQKRLLEQERQRQESIHSDWVQAVANHIEVPTSSIKPAIIKTKFQPTVNSAKIISKSQTKLVRNVVRNPKEIVALKSCLNRDPIAIVASSTASSLIRISRRKLVRRTDPSVSIALTEKKPTIANLNKIGVKATSKYKLDRRCGNLSNENLTTSLKNKKQTFVARYALRRGVACHVGETKSGSTSKYSKSMKPSVSNNKTLHLLNINGVLYKSTRNKLQRKISTSLADNLKGAAKKDSKLHIKCTVPQTVSGRTLFVRGTKFVMDANGFKLTRLPNNSSKIFNASQLSSPTKPSTRLTKAAPCQRIDIGGLTYVASSASKNVFVRTSNHVSRAHLNSAKQRSLQQLNRSLVKTNIPCGIFQRLGKCIAHERNKCRNVHDKRQVDVCAGFLRGDCNKSNCLLSHNVSLSKMPVCKFFLQALCVREDCPYLHKKLSVDAEFCADFLRGYCPLAEKCNKRHEFLCPEYERKGKCEITNCLQCKQIRLHAQRLAKRQQHRQQKVQTQQVEKTAPTAINRYFDAQLNEEDDALPKIVDELSKEEDELMSSDDNEGDEGNDDNENNAIEEDSNDEDETVMSKFKQRVQLGILPSYIPLS